MRSGPRAGLDLTRVRYGETPPGYRQVVSPKPLWQGCYEIEGLFRRSQFVIDSAGRLHSLPEAPGAD